LDEAVRAQRGEVGHDFFEGHRVAVEEAPHRAGYEGGAMLRCQQLGQLNESDVLLRRNRGQDHVAEGLDAVRVRVAALRLGADRTRGVARVDPTDGARRRNAKALGRSTPGHAACDGSDQPGTKVGGKRLAHARWPPAQPAW